MRLFTGISVEENAIPYLAELRKTAPLKWTAPGNLHITTKFIGEWPEARLPELKTALAGIPFPDKLTIAITDLEFHARVLFAVVEPSAELMELNFATENALEALGCARETRPYRPHITLARLAAPLQGALRETIATMHRSSGTFAASAFHLYVSRPGSLYTKLATYP